MYLVTGATGNVGRHVVAGLLANGEQVRAISRNPATADLPPGVEVLAGDFAEPAQISSALRGVKRAFLFPVPGQVEHFLDAARDSDLRQVVLLSGGAAVDPNGGAIGQVQARTEQAVIASGLAWTFLRPGPFMGNDLGWAHGIRSIGVVRAPFGRAASTPIDERDIAAVAVAALRDERHAGQTYALSGPVALTPPERVRIIGEVLGRELRFEELPAAEAREQALRHTSAPFVDAMFGLFGAMIDRPGVVSPTVADLTGHTHDYADWATLHAADFR